MNRKWGAIATLMGLILLAPVIKTFFETLFGEAETIVGGYPFIVNFIFDNFALIFIIVGIGAALLILFRKSPRGL